MAYPIPAHYPEYHSRPSRPQVSLGRVYSLLDSLFVLAGLVLAFWFALLLLLSGLVWQWHAIVALVAFWAVLTYVALPRLHQLLTTWYIPDYFLARSKTSDGLLGDPVNLALTGSAEDVVAAMRRAGWTMADEITLRSSLGIVKSSLLRTSYPEAPVSSLFLFGRKQDFAFQQEVDGSAAQRHHVRFWRVPGGWRLPGGHRVDWLAAGTFDTSVGLSTWTLQVTHKIDEDIDAERDYIIDTVRYTDHAATVEVIEDFTTAFHDRNGGGDAVRSDGNMPVLDVTGAAARAADAGLVPAAHSELIHSRAEVLDRELPPKQLQLAGMVIALKTVASLLLVGIPWLGQEVDHEVVFAGAAMLGISAVELVLYLATLGRRKWARLALLIVSTVVGVAELSFLTAADTFSAADLVEAGLDLLLVLSLSATGVRQWVFAVRRRSGIVGAAG
ncbi:hypothetical protein C1Y63_05735 [Corynebacterium sp. 13CS0277]|uniref:LssY C-terminal domain-containing protein n=1 Tax=Corynebacterium sp. 13CS0277 TaxID=2071994 RepID=UPI000D031D0F|nr:LssY C-terminal domain-containing protein [Corynebacterium sp. 13CS0277]PRQ11503.1 hypothetical protein C1Y63_05735 [Corynebacterium sp. 13CS0277]